LTHGDAEPDARRPDIESGASVRLSLSNRLRSAGRHRVDTRRAGATLTFVLSTLVLAGCASPGIDEVATPTRAAMSPTPSAAPPTAAVGTTLGESCESGKLRFGDLTAMDDGWRAGLSIAQGRALGWQSDAVLVELRVACELFEPGFRWQATYFSRDAQAYYSSDTAEIIPVEIDPRSVMALTEEDMRFVALRQILETNGYSDEEPGMRLESLRLLMSTTENPIGPAGVPADHAIGHLRIVSHGASLELYVDLDSGGIYRYGDQ